MAEDFEIVDPRFARLVNHSARVEQLYTGCRWTEGPAYFAAGRYLVWSDIPNDRMLRYDETDGHVSVFRQPSNFSNGNTTDRQGRLVTCEHGGRRVTRTNHDGSITTIADRWNGKRLNSPNDVVVRSDGSIWFTDPAYGIESDYEGHKAESEIGACHVYRVDPATGAVTAVIKDMVRPNGLAFTLDERRLYVVDTGRTHGPDLPAHMRVFNVDEAGSVSGGEVFADCTAGLFDGFRLDDEGRIWTSARDGIHCYHPDGTLLGKVRVPENTANCVFGGPKRNILYICATSSLYAVRLMVNGARLY
ncbi:MULTISPECIES: SMP-30/gluconolactonase/LRE family protein [unclassified Ensifer]|jgi:gluconolactonase|uniref:SMP-30/gluconolactonase/LRE family protein n=1 Tax=unclassified Ensifer TaxID=2633371 RepID=UPI000713E0A0|nr:MULTISPECIES: SMP-30/gluconolactonase/LRE family protein [unclassified Ensifer]KQX49684.1 gluconolactonase [Ensifer sp. Root1298]KQX78421.1 gluconolactonase [Ensifer sp. Root1312]KRC17895.1 gluconolactonase [Ensifer sp. Root74]KRD78136.1 gluconolactonase [Ensifer sp. Root954]MBD9524555.1 SMP-30/gluconolactonase/LRE family protein [Ensifer sp. ENS02]